MKNQKAVDYCHLKGFTALFPALFLVLTASCVSRKNCLICDPMMHDETFVKFDSAYVTEKWLSDKSVIDVVRREVGKPLDDTLIILTTYRLNKYPEILVKSGDSFIRIGYDETGCCSSPNVVRHYRGRPDNYENLYDSARVSTIFSWDIAGLSRRLRDIDYDDSEAYSVMIRVVMKNDRMQTWEEYSFDDPFILKDRDL